MLVCLQNFAAHLTIKSSAAQLAGIDVLRVHCERRLAEEVVLVVDELAISRLNLTKLLVAGGLSGWSDGDVRVAIVAIVVQKSLTDILESPNIVGLLGGLGEHAGVMVLDLINYYNCLLGRCRRFD